MTRKTAVRMQSEIYNTGKPCATYWTRHRAFSPFWRFCACGIFDALYAGRNFALHRIGRYVAKPQKVIQNRAPAARYRKSRNSISHIRRRQILHESGKHWFSLPDFKSVLPENPCKFGLFAKCLQFHLKNRLDNIHRTLTRSCSLSGFSKPLLPFSW